jgi:hypothetical protein
MIKYKHSEGLPFIPEMGGGRNMPQVYACDTRTQRVSFTDDLIFAPGKTGLFQLLILPDSQYDLDLMEEDFKEINQISNEFLDSKEATILIQSTDPSITLTSKQHAKDVARLATSDEFAADATLMRNRPYPTGYDEYRLKREVRGKKLVILRQDRFVFAACDSVAELKAAVQRLDGALTLKAML